jgi:8-oxo-dGTP pyrophosphatase MutT (NUDIX family)
MLCEKCKKCTLCFLVKENKVLLGMKKRGFGNGKWNGLGGKIEAGETAEDAAVREIWEESRIRAEKNDLERVAEIDFMFCDNPRLNNHTFVYILKTWNGEPMETEEMRPELFQRDMLPFEEMWSSDVHWIPLVLAGRKIRASVRFKDKDNYDDIKINDLDPICTL